MDAGLETLNEARRQGSGKQLDLYPDRHLGFATVLGQRTLPSAVSAFSMPQRSARMAPLRTNMILLGAARPNRIETKG